MPDEFNLTLTPEFDAARSAARDAAAPTPDIELAPVAHRYGRLALRMSVPGVAAPTSGALPASLTDVERLGLAALRLRESPAYLAIKANRPRRGETWDLPCDDAFAAAEAHRRNRGGGQVRAASPGNGYLEGPVAVGLVVVQGPTPDLAFSDAEITNVIAEVQNGLSFYIARNPLAGISFSYDIQNVTLDLPADATLADKDKEPYWRDPAMQALGYGTGGPAIDAYVQALRDNAGTQWSYIGYFTKYPLSWFAYVPAINGGYVVMDYNNDGWGPANIDSVFAHETGHIFGCPDEYAGASTSNATWTSQRFGIHNANSAVVAVGGGVSCLMKGNDFELCDYSPAHLGWEPNLVVKNFGTNAGSWHADKHPRLVADLDGNGLTDLVGFGDDGVWTALAIGAGRYAAPRLAVAGFAYNQGWRVERHPRYVADVAGNRMPGIVGFGDDGVWFAAGNGDGTFATPVFMINDLGYNQGWRVGTHLRTLADLTGDGRADLVGCGDGGIWTARSTGSGFAPLAFVSKDFGGDSGWTAARHPRLFGDVTGDGRADLVGCGDDGVWVAMSNGDGTFAPARFVLADLGYNQGWRVERHPRYLVNLGGGRAVADLVGFGDAGMYVARAAGDGGFTAPVLAVPDFGYDQGWRVEDHPRFLADTTGDGRLDVVACGDAGVYLSRQLADGSFEQPWLAMTFFGHAQGWNAEQPRATGDADGNGHADLIGFGANGVQLAKL